MALFKNASLDDRRNAAAAAKKATMEKFRALTAQINEGAAERSTARQAVISGAKRAPKSAKPLGWPTKHARRKLKHSAKSRSRPNRRNVTLKRLNRRSARLLLRRNARPPETPATPPERPADNEGCAI